MLYVVDKVPEVEGENSKYATAFELLGSKEDLRVAFQYITSLALAAAMNGEIQDGEVGDLLEELAPCKSPVRIQNSNSNTFTNILSQTQELAALRRLQLVGLGIEGKLSALALVDEIELLDEYAGGPLCPGEKLRYVTKDGIGMYLEEGSLSIEAYELGEMIEAGYFEEWEEALISGLPVTHVSAQYEIMIDSPPTTRVQSDRKHTSVGNIDESGSYIPYATILDPSHPAVKQPETPQ